MSQLSDRSHDLTYKKFTITIETPDGPLQPASVMVPEHPVTIQSIVPPMQNLTNGIITRVISKAAESGKSVSCGPDCGACCNQMVPLSPPEVVYFVEMLLALPPHQRFPILKNFEKNEEQLKKHNIWDELSVIDNTSRDTALAKEYFNLHLPCPFLDTSGSCVIHPVRPIICREYNVTTPALWCQDPFNNRIEALAVHRKMTTALVKLAHELIDTPIRLIPLPILFDWFERNKHMGDKKWDGPFLFERMIYYATKG